MTLHNDQEINPRRRHTMVNVGTPNIGAPQYIRQTLSGKRGEINSNTIIVQNINIHCHQWTDNQNKESTRNTNLKWNIKPNGHSWYFQNSIQMEKNTLSSQVHRKHSPV